MAIFQRVVERGSFAGAAEDVGLWPSAVAKLVTRLEQRLGVRLINRTTRHLALTAEGEIYLDRVREILSVIEAAESGRSRGRKRGPLTADRTERLQLLHDLLPQVAVFGLIE
jgi:DNA-binding transcriptional LysR family regulator